MYNKVTMDKNKKISLSTPHMSDEGFEKEYVNQAFMSNWIAPLGPMVDQFETEIIRFTGSKYAVALSSGTAAIHLALKSLSIKEGDIVFCQSLTFSATANPIIYEKAIPVFIDSENDTWNMSPILLKEAFKKYPNVKAVIIVHLYGTPAKMDEILSICNNHNVPLIEDAAESLGSTYKGKHTGTFGKLGILSFNGNKIITTSGGGMVISEDSNLIEKIRFWSTQSREKVRHYEHKELGYNYRMSNISAAIGLGQLRVLNDRINRKRAINNLYRILLFKNNNLKLPPFELPFNHSNCWLTTITLNNKFDVIPLIEFLEKNNIESRPVWKPMHLQPFFKGYPYIGDYLSNTIFESSICLPSDTKLSNYDISLVVSLINKYFNNV